MKELEDENFCLKKVCAEERLKADLIKEGIISALSKWGVVLADGLNNITFFNFVSSKYHDMAQTTRLG